jgi:tartrate dehydratase beta subunit/fumarate hydratase class I family protein
MKNGRRRPSCDGTSRMTRECQVRICERLGVKYPGPTRQKRTNHRGPKSTFVRFGRWSQPIDATLYLRGKRWSMTMGQRFRRGFTAAEKTELWERWQHGESLKAIGRAFGKPSSSIYNQVAPTVGAVTATASFRFASWLDGWFKLSGCNIIIGKGGMTSETYRRSFVPNHAIYLTAVGYGTGALLGRGIKRVAGVYWKEELGLAQAIWVLDVERFGPLLVESDLKGNSLFERENAKISPNIERLYAGTAAACAVSADSRRPSANDAEGPPIYCQAPRGFADSRHRDGESARHRRS